MLCKNIRKVCQWINRIGLCLLWLPLSTQASQDMADQYSYYVEVPHETYSIYEEGEMPVYYGDGLPTSYDAREHGQVLETRNQNPWGNCWSYATTAALEGSMLSSYPEYKEKLSEYHLNFYNYRSVTDPIGGTQGDSVQAGGSFTDFLEAGGNVLVAYHSLTNWMGAVDENRTGKVPTSEPQDLAGTVQDAYGSSLVHLQQMYQMSKADTADIKKAIMEYGAVTAAYYHSVSYLNYNTAGYYCDRYKSPNHAVALVGWDDTYSKDNFKVSPDEDGAWLVRNSWGEGNDANSYFWLSYEDATLHDTICALVGEYADNYDHNYQYDGSFWDGYIQASDLVVANVFRVPQKEQGEILQAVSFDLDSVNVDYSIQIYTGLTDAANPESGKPALETPVVGFTTYQGYYTVPLSKGVELEAGETFAVVITLDKELGYVRMGTEQSGNWNNIVFTASAEEGQSFYRSAKQNGWTDLGKSSQKNLRIKAFTDDIQGFTDVKKTDWSYPFIKYAYEKGIIAGKTSLTFEPNTALTRAEFVTMLYNYAGKEVVEQVSSFHDVAEGKWYTNPVLWAAGKGIVAGYGDGRFGVSDPITREQFLRMLYLYAGTQNEKDTVSGDVLADFEDADKVSSWARTALEWAVKEQLLVGKPLEEGKLYLDPQGFITRAEGATILTKFDSKP